MEGHLEADLVQQPAGSHRHPELEQRTVDQLYRHSLVKQVPRLVEVRTQQPVHEESRLIRHHDRGLSEPDRELESRGESRVPRQFPPYHFDEWHLVHGVEEVQPHDSLRAFETGGHRGDRQRRSIGREHGLGVEDVFQVTENLLLHYHSLYYRFDSEIDLLEAVVVEPAVDPRQLEPCLLLRKYPGACRLAQQVGRVPHARVERALVDVLEHRVDIVRRDQFRDRSTHHAGSDHGHPSDVVRSCHDRIRKCPLRVLREPEDPDQGA